jgi:hypothetical protein
MHGSCGGRASWSPSSGLTDRYRIGNSTWPTGAFILEKSIQPRKHTESYGRTTTYLFSSRHREGEALRSTVWLVFPCLSVCFRGRLQFFGLFIFHHQLPCGRRPHGFPSYGCAGSRAMIPSGSRKIGSTLPPRRTIQVLASPRGVMNIWCPRRCHPTRNTPRRDHARVRSVIV